MITRIWNFIKDAVDGWPQAFAHWGWMLLTTLIALGLLFLVGTGYHAVQEADEHLNKPDVPPMLADHAERAPGEPRGESVGASPNKTIARPTLFLEERGITFNYYQSPNWSPRGFNVIEAITVHVTGPGTCPGMRSWFSQPQSNASAHFGVCKDGSIEQYVEVGDGAWHNGIVNRPDLTNTLIQSWVASNVNPNSRTVGIELLLAPGDNLNDYPAMRQSFYVLMEWLNQTVKVPLDREHVIGHYQIDSLNRAVDPRCCVSIDQVLADLDQTPQEPPQPPAAGVLVSPPDYSPECWTEATDMSYGGRYNACSDAWVDRAGNFYDLRTRQWLGANGVPLP